MARLISTFNLLNQQLNHGKAVSKLLGCKVWFGARPVATSSSESTARLTPFPVLLDPIDVHCPQLAAAAQVAEEQLVKLENLTQVCMMGGGAKAQQSYTRKKMLPRERIARLWDNPGPDGMMELGTLAGLGMPYGDVPGAGIVAGIGKIHGRYCLVCANDGTLKGGTYFPITVRKQLYSCELAIKCGLPLVILVDSGGGFLPLQADLFPDKMHGGRMFFMEAVFGGHGLPSVAVICGSCTAGGAYGPSMCEEAAIVDGLGTLFLGGPPLVKAALGEEVTAEQLGGATLHSSVSGVTDYMVMDEEESFAVVRDSIATTNIMPAAPPLPVDSPLYPAATLDALSGRGDLDKGAMLAIIGRLADGSRFREFKQRYGSKLTVGFAFIQGKCVGLAANCGPLSYQDGLKGAHFLQLCQHRQLPLVFLQNSGGAAARAASLSLGPEDGSAAVRGRAAMAASLACLDTPKIAVNVAGCIQDDNYTMCGPGFDPTFSFSWPRGSVDYDYNSYASTDDASDAALQSKKSGSKSMFQFPAGSSWHHAAHVLTDGVIRPSDTRQVVAQCLDICGQKKRLQFQPKEFPVYRF